MLSPSLSPSLPLSFFLLLSLPLFLSPSISLLSSPPKVFRLIACLQSDLRTGCADVSSYRPVLSLSLSLSLPPSLPLSLPSSPLSARLVHAHVIRLTSGQAVQTACRLPL